MLLGKKVGFSLDEIKDMLDLYDLREGDTAQLEWRCGDFPQQIDALQQQKQDVEQAIEELTRTMSIVSGMLQDREATTNRSRCRRRRVTPLSLSSAAMLTLT